MGQTALDLTPKLAAAVEFAVVAGGGGGAVRMRLGTSIGDSSSSPDDIEWLSDIDWDGDGGDNVSSCCSCIIFLDRSWIDSFNVHN